MVGAVLMAAMWVGAAAAPEVNPASEAWIRDLSSDLPGVRRQAAVTLGRQGERAAVLPLIRLLGDSDAPVRREAARALGHVKDDRAVPGLIGALADPDANVRVYAAYALGEIRDRRAREALLQALSDPAWTVRDQAAWAIRELADPQLGPRLIELLSTPQTDVTAVMWLVQQMEPEQSLEIHTKLLGVSDVAVRARAVRALAAMQDPRRFAALSDALDDQDPAVRIAAIEGLLETRGEKLRTIFEERLGGERDAEVVHRLRDALQQLSPARHLAAWWSFDDRSTKIARDVTGNGNDGQIRGGEPVEGRSGAALRFGPGRAVELGQPPKLPIADRPFTVMAWARPEADAGVVVARGGAFCGFSLYVKDGVAKFGIRRAEACPGYIAAGDRRVVGQWVHLAGVVRETRIELYVDGRLAATKETVGFIPGNCGQGMEIGIDLGNSPAEIIDPFPGVLDEVKFFQAALSAEEIAEVKESP